MSRKATLDALFGAKRSGLEIKSDGSSAVDPLLGAPNNPAPELLGAPNKAEASDSAPRIRSGAIGAMGASLQQLKSAAEEADSLRQSMASGERVIAIDPALIDPAPIADRLEDSQDSALESLIESMRESGQQVPILVRPHPTKPGRWQAAYGHRRLKAAKTLGIQISAIVRQLSDAELAIAQGKENLERRDLSFIEKAFYAKGLEDAGFERGTIIQALGTDKADISRYLSIGKAMPVELVRIIGPAPKVGRARWQEMMDALAARENTANRNHISLSDLCRLLPQLAGFQKADSDTRFRLALERLVDAPSHAATYARPTNALISEHGRVVASFKGNAKRRQIDIDETIAPGFADYLAEAVPDLYRRWMETSGGKRNPKPE